MAKNIDTLTVKIVAEDVKPAVIKAMSMIETDLKIWQNLLLEHHYYDEAGNIQDYLDVLSEVDKEDF